MSAAPPPAPLARGDARDRLARIARMDRGALKELLADFGASIDAALVARAVAADARDGVVVEVAVALWGGAALLGAPAPDERAFVLAHALAAAPVASLAETDLDARLLTRLCARVSAGIAPESERALLAAQRADARVDAAAREIEAAHGAVRNAALGPGRASALWSTIEPRLR